MTLRVRVEDPIVAGDTVHFRWTQSGPNPFQQQNEFFFRYEGIELDAFAPPLFVEVFLGLQLKVFAGFEAPVEIAFPHPVPRSTVAFWTAFHNAWQVSITPVTDADTYSPWRGKTPQVSDPRAFAVFFGGGKDSMLATCLLSESFGREQILLIQYVGPLRVDPAHTAVLEHRQEELMLRPARERLGVATQRVWTDYQAQFRREGYNRRPNLELYTAGALPVLLARGVAMCGFNTGWQAYAVLRGDAGTPTYRYAGARPEMLDALSRHYQHALDAKLTATNWTLPFSSLSSAYRLLLERYPRAFDQIVMCTQCGVGERWCYDCAKCAEYALYGIRCGYVDPRFDYERFFLRSKYMRNIVRYAESGVELTSFGNAPWHRSVSFALSFIGMCHTFATLDPGVIRGRISDEAFDNLLVAIALFGNRAFPDIDTVARTALAWYPPEIGRRFRPLIEAHIETVDDYSGPCIAGDTMCEYDFVNPMATVPAVTYLR